LYARTDNNLLYNLSGNEGTLSWSSVLSSEVGVCSPASYSTDRLLFVVGKHVVEVNTRDGNVMHNLALPFLPTTNAARLDDRIFVGGEDKYFYCLRYDDGMVYWKSRCAAEPTGNVFVADEKVYFACKDGVLYVSQTNQRALVWQFATAGVIPGFVLDNQQCFVPSKDTAIYALNANNAQLLWPRYLAGGTFDQAPWVTKDAIYQTLFRVGVVCLDRQTGQLNWQLTNGQGLLSETAKYSYMITFNKELVLMNRQTHENELSFVLPDTDVHAANTQNGMIFLGTSQGLVVALQPDSQ
jgi:outer membrane protein assembly factor BamB